MIIETKNGPVRAALLIPTRGRWELMTKHLSKMSAAWNRKGVFLCVEKGESKKYKSIFKACPKLTQIRIKSQKKPCIGNALEALRKEAVSQAFDYYVFADDNTVFTPAAFNLLVRATHEWTMRSGTPVHMCGFHGTAKHFDARKLRTQLTNLNGLDTYPKVGWIFRCVPHQMLNRFEWPKDEIPCYSDRYHTAWLIANDYFEFRACVQAPFTKKRFVGGGIGDRGDRRTTARGLARLAGDFPQIFGPHEVRIPWTDMIAYSKSRAQRAGRARRA